MWVNKRTISLCYKALLVIVESGLVFLVLQATITGLTFAPLVPLSSFDFGVSAMVCLYILFSAMYPSIVIILGNCVKEPPTADVIDMELAAIENDVALTR
ncbi:hypothetical protein H0H81_007565 [Sphagnurus paluster]|uniref:Uncharacterized protein n=1 Tax=Sphagnurus paluster TaxID=117069 RepID=A0A9P7GNH1_9AGAR|nr:hypothetical protein H0H81_007565 [Sphagnurus paluster]